MIINSAFDELDSTRFQALINSLLLHEYSNVQCMPLHGRDGGRDALSLQVESNTSNFEDSIVFQVKQRKPSLNNKPTTDELYYWVVQALRPELKKLSQLRQRGAKHYVLITNIAATGDAGSGLRDRVADYLKANVSVPAMAWWHEDINSRLRARPQIAAAHGLLWGAEGLRSLLGSTENSIIENQKMIQQADDFDVVVNGILAFCRKQYKDEKNLRFRQAGFDKVDLVDSYTDVPVDISHQTSASARKSWNRVNSRIRGNLVRQQSQSQFCRREVYSALAADRHFDRLQPMIAEILLSRDLGEFGKMLIEGAPGQGKSTVTQYVCQVHRLRLLGHEQDAVRLPDTHRYSPIRLPIRIELRKYAAWYGVQSYQKEDNATGVVSYLRSEITAIADVAISTKGILAVLKATPSIIIFDGLDEIADFDLRTAVVQKIESLMENLELWKCDYRTVITSRPSTTQDLPSVSEESVQHFQLVDLPSLVINEYAEKWLKIRELPEDELDDFREVFWSAIKQPHVADLARNPMQLAILLFLINTKGWSLPDKRTDLYQAYIDTFMDREAEKSISVRENADLLLELHGYMAWILHTRAESTSDPEKSRGDIGRQELETIFHDYLKHEGRKTELVDILFKGTERVFVLVERDQGRFEFEVQPLREFFAGRYLYKSSPDDRATLEPKGGKPDRLEALIRNRYWFNVLRFYCGYYQKGELPDLSRRICDLALRSEWARVSHPFEVIESVIRDYSISSNPRDTSDMVDVLTTRRGLLFFGRELSQPSRARRVSRILPSKLGGEALVHNVRAALLQPQPITFTQDLCALLRVNDAQAGDWWHECCLDKHRAIDLSQWLRIGVLSGALERVSTDAACQIFSPDNSLDMFDWFRCVESGRGDVASSDEYRMHRTVDSILCGPVTIASKGMMRDFEWLSFLRYFMAPRMWVQPEMAQTQFLEMANKYAPSDVVSERIASELRGFFRAIVEAYSARLRSTSGRLKAWVEAISSMESIAGDSWSTWRCALLGAASTRKDANWTEGSETLDRTRAWMLDAEWAKELTHPELLDPKSSGLRLAVTAGFFCWASTAQVIKNLQALEGWFSMLGVTELAEARAFVILLNDVLGSSMSNHLALTSEQVESLSEHAPGLRIFLLPRIQVNDRVRFMTDIRAANLNEHEIAVVNGEIIYELQRMLGHRKFSTSELSELSQRYTTARTETPFMELRGGPPRIVRLGQRNDVGNLVNHVLDSPHAYPGRLMDASNRIETQRLASQVRSLRDVADSENWFKHDADKKEQSKAKNPSTH